MYAILLTSSAGVGRTGTLIAIDVELQRAMKEGVVNSFNYVTKLREQRNNMVQTEVHGVYNIPTNFMLMLVCPFSV